MVFWVIDDWLKSFTDCLLYCSDLSPAVCHFYNDWPGPQTSASLLRLWLSLWPHQKGNGVSHLAIYGISALFLARTWLKRCDECWISLYWWKSSNTERSGAKNYSMCGCVWPLKYNTSDSSLQFSHISLKGFTLDHYGTYLDCFLCADDGIRYRLNWKTDNDSVTF